MGLATNQHLIHCQVDWAAIEIGDQVSARLKPIDVESDANFS